MSQVIQASELLATERAAIITAILVRGGTVTAAEVASMIECTQRGAFYILNKISRVLPITNDEGRWFYVGQ